MEAESAWTVAEASSMSAVWPRQGGFDLPWGTVSRRHPLPALAVAALFGLTSCGASDVESATTTTPTTTATNRPPIHTAATATTAAPTTT